MAFRFLGLILLPWTLQPGGGQTLKQLGPPILVTLAHHHLPLTCEFTYLHSPTFGSYEFRYYHIDLQGRQSPPILTGCSKTPGVENQTYTEQCPFNLTALHNSSATGTYYCQVQWSSQTMTGRGTFILVLDAEYKEPPEGSKKLLLFTLFGLLAVLSILGTGLLLWKAKKHRRSAKKLLKQKDLNPARSSADPNSERSGSLYTALQPHLSEVYDHLQNDTSTQLSEWSPPLQHERGTEELNAIYENF
ncbi:NFAT activation molecule 1 isoform X2 [Dromiciops gliroides]|uniref:NFAT activation molecule 1 isoform X2 n=1 Tax=Dromiciops gliroides TaxID=33562 RepID=UPI001CC5A42F|nr:NFAT activation molecule 1 isoform X2 [Dromiciops gliroides]